jgi:PPOX class probable F420-dependent enzyme
MDFVPADFRDLLSDEVPAISYLATTQADGSPVIAAVWFQHDGDDILISSREGTTKHRNMEARPEVALLIQDPQNAYRYLQLRGKVIAFEKEGAHERLDQIAIKYTGKVWSDRTPDPTRVIYRLRPEKANVYPQQ